MKVQLKRYAGIFLAGYLSTGTLAGNVGERHKVRSLPSSKSEVRVPVRAENAKSHPQFVGLADTIEEAIKTKLDAELAGLTHVVLMTGD